MCQKSVLDPEWCTSNSIGLKKHLMTASKSFSHVYFSKASPWPAFFNALFRLWAIQGVMNMQLLTCINLSKWTKIKYWGTLKQQLLTKRRISVLFDCVSCAFKEKKKKKNTYIFEEPLHEGEPEVIRDTTRVSSVDMFLISSRELLGFFTFAAVSQNCKSHTATE